MSFAIQNNGSTTAGNPFVFAPSASDWIETLLGEKMLFRVRSDAVGGRYTVIETIAAPGSASPEHYHKEDEVFQVLSGTMTFKLSKEIISARAGSTVVIPAGVPHCWKNRSDDDVRMLATFTPGGVDMLFAGLAGVQPEDIPAFAAGYGTIVVGPPLD